HSAGPARTHSRPLYSRHYPPRAESPPPAPPPIPPAIRRRRLPRSSHRPVVFGLLRPRRQTLRASSAPLRPHSLHRQRCPRSPTSPSRPEPNPPIPRFPLWRPPVPRLVPRKPFRHPHRRSNPLSSAQDFSDNPHTPYLLASTRVIPATCSATNL